MLHDHNEKPRLIGWGFSLWPLGLSGQERVVVPERGEHGIGVQCVGPADRTFRIDQAVAEGVVKASGAEIHCTADQNFPEFTTIDAGVLAPDQCGDTGQVGIGSTGAVEVAHIAVAINRLAVRWGHQGEIFTSVGVRGDPHGPCVGQFIDDLPGTAFQGTDAGDIVEIGLNGAMPPLPATLVVLPSLPAEAEKNP